MRAIIFALFALFVTLPPLAAMTLSPQAAMARAPVDGHWVLFGPATQWLNTTRPLTKADAEGRLVLLDFWTYGCINCMHIVPDLKELEKEFGDRLLVIGVHSAKFKGESGSDRIVAAAQRFGLAHPVINDSSFDIWDQFNVNAWPTLILLDGAGHEIGRYAGEGNLTAMQRDIRKAIPDLKGAASLAGVVAEKKDSGVLSFPARLGLARATPWGDIIFIADGGHNRIVGITADGAVKVIIGSGAEGKDDGDFKSASFHNPRGFAVTKNGLYVADTENHLIRFVDFKTQKVTTVAGTGAQGFSRTVVSAPALETAISSPWDAKMLADGKTLAIAMAGTHQLWSLDTETAKLSVIAGTGKEFIDDGAARTASLSQPSGLAVWGDTLYFADAETSALRALKFGQISTLVGTGLFDFGLVDGTYPRARMQHAQGLAMSGGNIIVADTYNNALRKFDTASGTLSTIITNGETLLEPGDVLPLGENIYIADTGHHRIAVLDTKTGTISALDLKQP